MKKRQTTGSGGNDNRAIETRFNIISYGGGKKYNYYSVGLIEEKSGDVNNNIVSGITKRPQKTGGGLYPPKYCSQGGCSRREYFNIRNAGVGENENVRGIFNAVDIGEKTGTNRLRRISYSSRSVEAGDTGGNPTIKKNRYITNFYIGYIAGVYQRIAADQDGH